METQLKNGFDVHVSVLVGDQVAHLGLIPYWCYSVFNWESLPMPGIKRKKKFTAFPIKTKCYLHETRVKVEVNVYFIEQFLMTKFIL